MDKQSNTSSAADNPSSPSKLVHIDRFVFRPFILACVFITIVFAGLQAVGRGAMMSLYIFEADLNIWLSNNNIVLRQVKGGWHGLNPVLRIGNINTPEIQVKNIRLELDVLESIARSALIAQSLVADDIQLNADRTEQGWRLRGFDGPQSDFDVEALIRHSDIAAFRLSLLMRDTRGDSTANSSVQMHADVQAMNFSFEHFVQIRLSHSKPESDVLVAQMYSREPLLWLQSGLNRYTLNGSVDLPQLATDVGEFGLTIEDGYWQDFTAPSKGQAVVGGQGELGVEIKFRRTHDSVPVLAQFETQIHGAANRIYAVTSPLLVQGAQQTLQIEPLHLGIDMPTDDGLLATLSTTDEDRVAAQIWLSELDLAAVSNFFSDNFGDWEPAGRWIKALAVSGYAKNVHGFVSQKGRFGYAASVTDLGMHGYKGAPTLEGGQARIWGHTNAFAVQLNASDVYLQFPALYHNHWDMAHLSGVLKGWVWQRVFRPTG